MQIRMRRTVRADIIYLARPGTILKKDLDYHATANSDGTVFGICDNGQLLSVSPSDFTFVKAPSWLVEAWKDKFPDCVEGTTIEG